MTNASTTSVSTMITFRLDNETYAAIQAILARSLKHSPGEPYTVTTWIRKAIAEKIAHNRRRGKRVPKTADQRLLDRLFPERSANGHAD